MVRPPHPLQKGSDGSRRADLAHQLHRTDVDTELEGSRGDEGPQVAGAQSCLDDASPRRRKTAVMRRHEKRSVDILAVALRATETLSQLVRHTLGHLSCVDEDQRRAVLPSVVRDAVQDVRELQPTGHGFQLTPG